MIKLKIQRKHDFSNELQNYFKSMSITSEYELIGSSHYKNFIYNNDYDLNEYNNIKNTSNNLHKLYMNFLEKFKNIQNNPNAYITDFKCGEYKNVPIRWNYKSMLKGYQILNDQKILFEDCLRMNATIKLDEIVIINGLFTEITNNYFLFKHNNKNESKNEIIRNLSNNYNELIHEGKYFKALKRKASIYQINHKNKIQKTMLNILNSDDGRLYKCINDLHLLIILLELKEKHRPSLQMIMNNLQSIKYFCSKITKFNVSNVSNDIDKIVLLKDKLKIIKSIIELIDKLNTTLNKDAKQFL